MDNGIVNNIKYSYIDYEIILWWIFVYKVILNNKYIKDFL